MRKRKLEVLSTPCSANKRVKFESPVARWKNDFSFRDLCEQLMAKEEYSTIELWLLQNLKRIPQLQGWEELED